MLIFLQVSENTNAFLQESFGQYWNSCQLIIFCCILFYLLGQSGKALNNTSSIEINPFNLVLSWGPTKLIAQPICGSADITRSLLASHHVLLVWANTLVSRWCNDIVSLAVPSFSCTTVSHMVWYYLSILWGWCILPLHLSFSQLC